MNLKFIKKNYYAGSYIYLYGGVGRYYKIIVDTPKCKFKGKHKEKVTIFKQDLRGKFISSYNFVKGFNTFSKAKKHLKELVN